MSIDPATQGRALPLAKLREAFRDARSDADLEAWIESLAGDSRVGARALETRARGRIESGHRERERLSGLLALRDELDARGVRGIAGVDVSASSEGE